VSFAVANGKVDTISCGDTRNEDDFVSHIKEVVERSLSTSRWHFVADNLNIHKSESLVRYVADVSDLDIDLGIKGRDGILDCTPDNGQIVKQWYLRQPPLRTEPEICN